MQICFVSCLFISFCFWLHIIKQMHEYKSQKMDKKLYYHSTVARYTILYESVFRALNKKSK